MKRWTASELLQDELNGAFRQRRLRLVEARQIVAIGVVGGDHAKWLHLVGELREQAEDVYRDRRTRRLLAEREGDLVVEIEVRGPDALFIEILVRQAHNEMAARLDAANPV